MAEYFPLLDRAVSGLTEPTAEARRSIYERARTALVGQLRRMDPPIPEEDIARESAALDEAIARVEARFSDGRTAPAAEPDAAPAVIPAPPPAPEPQDTRALPDAPQIGVAPPVVPPPSRERPVLGPRPASSVDRPALPIAPPVSAAPRLAPPPRGALPPRGTRPVMPLRPVAPPADARDGTGLPTAAQLAPAAGTAAEQAAVAEPRADAGETPGFAAALDAAGRADGDRIEAEPTEDAATASRMRDAAQRPRAPRPRQPRRFVRPLAATLGVVGVLAMVGIGVAAYRLRDRPEQVVATRAAVQADAATPGKVVERASPAAADATDAVADAPAGSGVSVPVPQGTAGDAPATAIAVAQRAALLVDAPDDPQRVKTYVGTVVWHLDSVSPGGGQPLATAVKADIDIPDAKIKVTMLMQRNPEPQLPASHTIEFHVLPQPGNTLGPIKQVNVPEMRKDDDAPTGDPLVGVPVAITDNYFLVGLSRGAAEPQNLRLITERNWFDMSVLFTSGKLGKLTFEKGAAGERVIQDALKAWK